MRVLRAVASVAAGVMIVGGASLVAAPAASAADLGSYIANCFAGGRVDVSISGQVGDTFTVDAIDNTVCVSDVTPAGVATYVATVVGLNDRAVVTLVAPGEATFTFRQSGNGTWFAITVAAAPAAVVVADAPPIPAWVQAYGREKDATCLDGWDASWQSWAEPVTGGWVCTRSIPSLG